MVTKEEMARFTESTNSRIEELRRQILRDAAEQFGPRFQTAEVSFPRGRKVRTLPVEDVWADFYYEGSGPPYIILRGRCTHPETSEKMTVFLSRVGRANVL
jgi:hypothetical protein